MFLIDKKTWHAIIKVIQENLANIFLGCAIFTGAQMHILYKADLGGSVMKREEILEKSRKENSGEDFYEKEVMRAGGELGIYTVWIFAAVFSIVQVLLCHEWNYAVYALAGVFYAAVYAVKARRQKQRQDMIGAVGWSLFAVVFFVMHFCQLV